MKSNTDGVLRYEIFLTKYQKNKILRFNTINDPEATCSIKLSKDNFQASNKNPWRVEVPAEYFEKGGGFTLRKKCIKTGGFLPFLIPMLAGLAAVTGIASNVAKPIIQNNKDKAELDELRKHYKNIETKLADGKTLITPAFAEQGVEPSALGTTVGHGLLLPKLPSGWDYEFPKEKKTYKHVGSMNDITKRLLIILAEEKAGNVNVFNEEKQSILEYLKSQITAETETLLIISQCISKKGDGIGNFINSLIDKIPIEMHVPGYKYLGPGTYFETKSIKDRPRDQPINKLDRAAFEHDAFYHKTKDTSERRIADKILQEKSLEIMKDSNNGFGERLVAGMTAGTMRLKRSMGAGVFNFEQNLPRTLKNGAGVFQFEQRLDKRFQN